MGLNSVYVGCYKDNYKDALLKLTPRDWQLSMRGHLISVSGH